MEEMRVDEITETALVKVKPESDLQVQAFYQEALRALEYAEARSIVKAEDLKPATEDLALISKLKRSMEERRKEYLKPLDDHRRAINDAFKMMMTPIERADAITRDKILAFQLKQKLIREEQERINALRLEAAQKEMELKGEITESVNLVEVSLEVKRVQTDLGTAGMRDNWTYEVIDFLSLPNEYKVPDAAKIGKVVRAGLRNIPGVRIFNEPILVVNTR